MSFLFLKVQYLTVRNSVITYLEERSRECEDVLECIAGFGELEKEIYFQMSVDEALTVDEIAEKVERERSTVFRSLKKLKDNSFIEQDTKGLEGGSYVNIYTKVSPEEVSEDMRERIEEWATLINKMIDEFEEKYSGPK